MSEAEISLKPTGRSDIHKLETALVIATLLREDVLRKIRESTERLTWIDSLAVAAGALARSKAGMSIVQIADDLGRSEITIRRHLQGKSEAGKLILETYERFIKEGVKIELPSELSKDIEGEVEKVKMELSRERRLREELERKLRDIKKRLEEIIKEI